MIAYSRLVRSLLSVLLYERSLELFTTHYTYQTISKNRYIVFSILLYLYFSNSGIFQFLYLEEMPSYQNSLCSFHTRDN